MEVSVKFTLRPLYPATYWIWDYADSREGMVKKRIAAQFSLRVAICEVAYLWLRNLVFQRSSGGSRRILDLRA
jgi:hypothetical protein